VLFAAVPHVCGAQGTAKADSAIRPFTIRVPDAVLADMKVRLKNPRYPRRCKGRLDLRHGHRLPEAARGLLARPVRLARSGARAEPVRAVHDDIDGLTIHFIHRRARQPNAFPLLITHAGRGRSSSSRTSSVR